MENLLHLFFVAGPTYLWPIWIGVLVLAVLAALLGSKHRPLFVLLAGLVWVASGLLGLRTLLPDVSPLTASYDITAWLVVASLAVAATVLAAYWTWADPGTKLRTFWTVLAAGAAVLVPSPILVLVIHCLSGDCI